MPSGMPACLVLTLGTMLFAHPIIAAPIPVISQPYSALAIYPPRSAPATVVSDNQSRISAEVSARILDIPVRVGDNVKQGTVLVRLDQQDSTLALMRQEAALAAVKAKLDLAEYELKRARSLSKKQAVSEQLLKQRETERDALLAEQQGQQAAYAQAQRQIDKTQIRAPFNAVVVERLAQMGELANPGTALLSIIDIDNLELAAKLSPSQTRDLTRLFATENNRTVSSTVEFVSSGQRYAVTLRTITPVLATQARTQEARLLFTSNKPLPGTAGQLVWTPQQASLPADLISQRNGKLGVFIQAGNKARFVELPRAKTGQPVVSKLEPDTLIITRGRYRLQDGDTVSPANTDAATP